MTTIRILGEVLPQNGPMTRTRPGEPGHGGTVASLRLRPVRIVDGVAQGGWTSQWEIICPACGDDDTLDYRSVSPYLQRVRGPYLTEQEGVAALRCHRGLAAESPATAPAETGSAETGPAGIEPAWAAPTSSAPG